MQDNFLTPTGRFADILLPACTQFETYGSATASNRSLQWRDKVIDPLFDAYAALTDAAATAPPSFFPMGSIPPRNAGKS